MTFRRQSAAERTEFDRLPWERYFTNCMAERDPHDPKRRRLEGVIPDLLKRAVEIGVEKASEAPDSVKHFVNEMKMPKEIAQVVLAQIDETKNGIFRVVAKEMRDFLEHTNFANELQKILTTVQFEINTTIRFTPNDGSQAPKEGDEAAEPGAEPKPEKKTVALTKPEVKTDMFVVREDGRRERRRTRE